MDLNLLTALDALLDKRGVGAAADRLHLSQPAMSRTLGRIRRATGDQILVRSGRSMLLTPYAEEIQHEVHQLVVRAQSVLAPAADGRPRRRPVGAADQSEAAGAEGRAGQGRRVASESPPVATGGLFRAPAVITS